MAWRIDVAVLRNVVVVANETRTVSARVGMSRALSTRLSNGVVMQAPAHSIHRNWSATGGLHAGCWRAFAHGRQERTPKDWNVRRDHVNVTTSRKRPGQMVWLLRCSTGLRLIRNPVLHQAASLEWSLLKEARLSDFAMRSARFASLVLFARRTERLVRPGGGGLRRRVHRAVRLRLHGRPVRRGSTATRLSPRPGRPRSRCDVPRSSNSARGTWHWGAPTCRSAKS